MALINTGIGVSQKDNLIEATKEAAEKAKKELGGEKPRLLMFFCLYAYPRKYYKEAIETVYDVFEDKKIPLVGGNVLGFFAKDKYYFDVEILGKVAASFMTGVGKIVPSLKFKGVAVVAIHSDYLSVGTGVGLNAFEKPEKAGRDCITQALDNLEYNPSMAYLAMMKKGARDITRFRPINGFLITSGLKCPENVFFDQKILDGIVSLTKRTVRLAGGGTCDGIRGRVTAAGHIFYNNNVYKNAVVSIVFGSDLEIGYGLASGAEPLPQKAVVTKSKDYVIYELNNRPAIDVLREFFEQYSDKKIKDFLDLHYSLLTQGYMMGFTDTKGDFYWSLAFPSLVDGKYPKSWLPLKEGLGISLVRITKESAQKATIEATKIMAEDAQTEDFGFVLFASCAVRGQILGKKYFKEVEMIKKALNKKELPIFGICSNGEQGFYKTGPLMGGALMISMMGISNRLISETKK